MTFEEWWQLKKSELHRDLDDHGLVVREVAQMAWNEAVDSCALVAFDMPLENSNHHSYRWTDTAKAMAWDISYAIKKRLLSLGDINRTST